MLLVYTGASLSSATLERKSKSCHQDCGHSSMVKTRRKRRFEGFSPALLHFILFQEKKKEKSKPKERKSESPEEIFVPNSQPDEDSEMKDNDDGDFKAFPCILHLDSLFHARPSMYTYLEE
jgi:hypothetical protein